MYYLNIYVRKLIIIERFRVALITVHRVLAIIRILLSLIRQALRVIRPVKGAQGQEIINLPCLNCISLQNCRNQNRLSLQL